MSPFMLCLVLAGAGCVVGFLLGWATSVLTTHKRATHVANETKARIELLHEHAKRELDAQRKEVDAVRADLRAQRPHPRI